MKIFVGLGNPGAEYIKTRHNAGFMMIDALKERIPDLQPERGAKFNAEVWRNSDFILVKPQTFMNASGQSVRSVLDYFTKEWATAVEPGISNLYIFHDDLDLALGSYKLHWGKGPKVHNGLLSVYQYLKTDLFWHGRLGVDGRQGDRSMPGSAYVLQSFSSGEWPLFTAAVSEIVPKILI